VLTSHKITKRLDITNNNWIYGDPAVKESRLIGAACACALVLSTFTTQAALVYEQPWGNTVTGPFSQTLGNIPSNSQEIADNFTAQNNWILNRVSWFGSYSGAPLAANNDVNFLIRFYTDTGGLPSDTPFYEQSVLPTYTDTTSTSTLFGYEFTAILQTPLTVQNGSTYWISIQDDDVLTQNFIWNGNILGVGDSYAYRQTGGWALDTSIPWGLTDRAFSLYTVPIPPALWLFLSGLLGLTGVTRRKKQ
jgi:hypothetical protein